MDLSSFDRTDLVEMLTDWFVGIEEVDLEVSDKLILMEIAELILSLKHSANEHGIQDEDFEEWLRFHVLEHWSEMMEDMALEGNSVDAFYQFIQTGQERLYLQMLKTCMPLTQVKSA